jgi:hypothetical protein
VIEYPAEHPARDIVAMGMHPWVNIEGGGQVRITMPSHREVQEAADRLIAHLYAEGYVIVKRPQAPLTPKQAYERAPPVVS